LTKAARWLWNRLIDLVGRSTGRLLQWLVRHRFVHFPFLSEALACLPFSAGYKLRACIYGEILPRVGTDVVIHFGVVIEDPRTCFGSDVWISRAVYIDYADVGDFVLIGPHACLLAGGRQHKMERTDVPIKTQGNPEKQPTRIGRGAWIGANAVVMASVGADAIVGAGSVVTRDVPPRAIVAGNPARVLRFRENPGPAGSVPPHEEGSPN